MKRPWLLAALLGLTACAGVPDHASRQDTAQRLAAAGQLAALSLDTSTFSLAAWAGPVGQAQGGLLTVYIEGDGLAWLSAQTPSADPTPLNPLALRLALAQADGARAYLARPCQYGGLADRRCATGFWTQQRFAPAVIEASDQALDQLKQRAGARALMLVGYSGGGAVAALLAGRRDDVAALVTVAGNLDPNGWTRLHRVSPLVGSLDPSAAKQRLRDLPQWHFVGGADGNMPASLARGFVAGLGDARVVVVEGANHQCCWAERWAELVEAPLKAAEARSLRQRLVSRLSLPWRR
jgi:dienelactone hydrolase